MPFQTPIDYLEGAYPLSEFLEDFPTVSSEQAIAALGAANGIAEGFALAAVSKAERLLASR